MGSVLDPTPAAVVGAQVHVVDDATGKAYDTTSGEGGHFAFGNLPPGSYTVTITKEGFKKAVYKNVKVIVGQTYDLGAKLEVGEIGTQIVVEAGQEVLETASATVGTVITGKALTSLPFTSRDALDLATLMPGAQTTGRPRQSSFEGLPKGAINVTIDGINVQDTVLKSNDGFFATIRPRVDDVAEFSIATAAQGAEQTGQGAVGIHFSSVRGSNAWHGGGWEYLRNDWFNANYYFSNQSNPQLTRQIFRLNEYGFKVGGPIIKEKLFVFADMDIYSNPQSQIKSRNVPTAAMAQGLFKYVPVNAAGTNCTPGTSGCAALAPNAWTTCDATTGVCTANLIQAGSAAGGPSAIDSFVAGTLQQINSIQPGSGGIVDLGSPCTNAAACNQRAFAFNTSATGKRYFPDFRLDWNITKNHSFEFDYHYGSFNANKDLLNGGEESYPITPYTTSIAGQISNRNLFVGAWRWVIGNNKSNELRYGVRSNPLSFSPQLNKGIYPQGQNNLGPIRLRPLYTGLLFSTNPYKSFTPQGRNDAIGQLIDTFTWTKGAHSLSFGADWFELYYNGFLDDGAVGSVGFGMSSSDTLTSPFSNNLDHISSNDLGNAQTIYSNLIGRVTSYSGNLYFDPVSRQYKTGVPDLDKVRHKELGFYAQDSWRVRPTLTFNYGLRWEYQGSPYDVYNETFRVQGDVNGLFGVSGANNLFKPGTLSGSTTTVVLNNGKPWFDHYYKAFAPSVGLAWSPGIDNSLWKKFFGVAGKTVFRAGYSISYTREGLNGWFLVADDNPGYSGSQNATVVGASQCAPCQPGTFQAGTVNFSSLNIVGVKQTPSSFTNTITLDASTGQGTWSFAQNLYPPRVQSWSVGMQREITPSMALEIRYVGNHAVGLPRAQNLNEVNIFENGFLQEFAVAKHNLDLCNASPAACVAAAGDPVGSTRRYFSNLGLPGQAPVPIMTASFTGTGGQQNDANFRSSSFITQLNNGVVGSMASSLNTLAFWTNLKAAGFPSNFWMVNPDSRGGATLAYNGAQSTYNALVVEFRRRPSKGLQFNANYSFSKSLTDYFADSSTGSGGFTTIRIPGWNKGPAPFDLRHQFKAQGIYELPFGPGRKWSSSNWVASRLMGGWEINAITRWQSGRVAQLTSGLGGTFSPNDPGIVLIGLDRNQLQSQMGIYKTTPATPPGQVFWWPQSLLASNGTSNQSFVAPCKTPGQLCGRTFITGPRFFRADISLAKHTKVTERVSTEIRAEFLNAFNNINFLYGANATSANGSRSITSTGTSVGRIFDAYQDISTTDDPGGRIIQMVFRINF